MEEASEEYLASPHAMLPANVTPMSGRARYGVDDSMDGLRIADVSMAVCQSLHSVEVRVSHDQQCSTTSMAIAVWKTCVCNGGGQQTPSAQSYILCCQAVLVSGSITCPAANLNLYGSVCSWVSRRHCSSSAQRHVVCICWDAMTKWQMLTP